MMTIAKSMSQVVQDVTCGELVELELYLSGGMI